MRISQLEGKRVALWGWGREGRAAYQTIRSRLPALPLTLFCNKEEAEEATALADPLLTIHREATAESLSAQQVVVKSPGISPYSAAALAASANGTLFIGGSTLWFDEHAGADGIAARTLCVTGTKGKSTTTALLAHLLRAGGHRTALVGNIGMPLLEVLDPQPAPEFWAIELSSYQTLDVAAAEVGPEVALVLNIFPEHLDWHGSEARYIADKLALVTQAGPKIAILNAADARLASLQLAEIEVHWFNHAKGWHLRGDDVYRGDAFVFDATRTPLPGRHNRGNLCAVLATIEALGLDAAVLAAHAESFRPLPNRLQALGERDGILYVNDSISTTPHATLAALECFHGQPIAVLVGGHDRGVDWSDFAEAMKRDAPEAIVTMGANGPRIHELLAPLAAEGKFKLEAAGDLESAVGQARRLLGDTGVILLSPGAPSFGVYKDYVARGRHFAAIAGFDPDTISAIPGIGIS
ncbi:UDP-N-acetylmuramoyl-L-alanine--D-glutamate ligase [Pseudoxanthomonas sacheonensis]|uniref:UDP-N-acetylmuramoyl-L-alanine--L-glutamate ligase n=1 Tax=Pseudoxanthomonas sacheonensis TaxID=443615 RepID=A0ABU1RMK9_9GAMM|nr:UDP-N-acetylmuramoyl-L-alanine--D-glutamate ligase [Pseudoxanthomonas sacheonensis]MDR6840011.1 UDP-N-acetylmuramoylalanine--D-glutamate ligase [Pseudoxanthomonas sacheonensis]